MKRIVLLALLVLAFPLAAFADSVDFSNLGGTLTGSSAGLTLTGSELSAVVGLGGNGPVLGDLGTVTFTTGSLLSGSLATNAVFNSGGSFTITGNGTNGVPNGVLFSGSFTSTVTWAYASTLSNGSKVFDISGKVSGGSTIQGYAVVGSNGFTQVYGTSAAAIRLSTPFPSQALSDCSELGWLAWLLKFAERNYSREDPRRRCDGAHGNCCFLRRVRR
jgi:hypothetical protein